MALHQPDGTPLSRHTTPQQIDPARWRMLAMLATAELLGMSLWFAGTAAAPDLAARWDLTPTQVGWVATAVQLGFVAGTAVSALLNLADILPARLLFSASALAGAVANGWLATADSLDGVLFSRFVTGACLAGVYPPAMKMAATWFRARRGLAVGTVVGALTVGKAGPYLLAAWPGATVPFISLTASGSAALASLIVFFGYREGPHPFPARPFSWSLAGEVVRERRWRLATGGYLGHMAELYSYWAWIPAFASASLAAYDPTLATRTEAGVISFGIIAVGGVGCIWGGLVADRIGRARLVSLAMAVSGSCALLVGLTFGRNPWLLVPVALTWGFFVIADSAQFSVMVAESVPPHAAGTALTLQTSLGFLLTTLTIQLIPMLVNRYGWAWAFAPLAVGPALGILAIGRLGDSAGGPPGGIADGRLDQPAER